MWKNPKKSQILEEFVNNQLLLFKADNLIEETQSNWCTAIGNQEK